MPSEAPWLDHSLFGILGLLIGSFLNVVIHRLPVMLERQWAVQSAEITGTSLPEQAPFNLMTPRSRCPHCGHLIAWYENVPVLSYALLRGKCSECREHISLRYPAIELATGGLFFFCAWKWGTTPTGMVWCAFCAVLLTLAMIDWDTTLLPDDLTLPLLWMGLVAAAMQWTSVGLHSALWGAVAGYLSLWSIYWVFKWVTGKEGMGYGDFKLFAALGAWFGWPMLVPIILMASLIGAMVGILIKFSVGLRPGGYVPFGPFLATAGLASIVFGPQALQGLVYP